MVLWVQYGHVPVAIIRVDNSSCCAPIFVHHFAADDNKHSQDDDSNDTSYHNAGDGTGTSAKIRLISTCNACLFEKCVIASWYTIS